MGAVYRLVSDRSLSCQECGRSVAARQGRRNLPCGHHAPTVADCDLPCCCGDCVAAADALQAALEDRDTAAGRSDTDNQDTFTLGWYWVLLAVYLAALLSMCVLAALGS